MFSSARVVLLTGATGLLGRYLLRDLLLAEYRVVVLVRGAGKRSGRERIQSILRMWNEELGVALPEPTVLSGDLCSPRLGLNSAEQRWLSGRCDLVLHAAASLEFRHSADDEPFRTNVEGTRRLIHFCRKAAVREFHHVSTAFVCGANAQQPVLEVDGEKDRNFNNPYEQSKWAAEGLLRNAAELQPTVYRPSIIVGDSRTGYTSTYHGIYRFAEMAVRLAKQSRGKRRSLDMRLPMTGDEPRNLVPVDWVSRAIVRIVEQPSAHGRNYHLVSPAPVPVRLLHRALEEALGLDGLRLGGTGVIANPSYIERHFLQRVRQYLPYLQGDPVFDRTNLQSVLPGFDPPKIDRDLLNRLFEFADRNDWGQSDRVDAAPRDAEPSACRAFMEESFPRLARRSSIGRALMLEVVVGVDIEGPQGGRWTLRWEQGELIAVERGRAANAAVVYRMDSATFTAVREGGQSPAEAFFEQRLQIEGDIEQGLKLAVWLEQLLREESSPTLVNQGVPYDLHA